ncbi:replication factor A protein 1-like [Rutidosis leptorrhynchoides]|uniref:replication factor A protein 1-like n=1 Tax=Rutidosis leptorrhynchoides TaxID=125765 RepID=UPI003A98DCE8
MATNTSTHFTNAKDISYVYLDQLQEGKDAHVRVMICRKWDTNTIYGKYISSDFIVCDQRGNIMQCTAKSNVAHCFINKLQEGCVYSIGMFSVIPNKNEYRILKDNQLMLELQGSTYVRKDTIDVAGFIRHPFQCVEFENLTPTFKEYLVDVIGYVTNVGEPSPQKTGAKTLDLFLTNQRGRKIRATLWGSLGDDLVQKKSNSCGLYAIILTSVIVKNYNNEVSISSTTSTLIIDDAEIPTLKEFKSMIGDVEVSEDVQHNLPVVQLGAVKEGTLDELLQLARKGKTDVVTFRCKVKIQNIRTKNGWYYLSCSICKCKKAVSRQSGNFWCDSCEKTVDFPRTRFRLQMDVTDETAQAVIVMFDETAEKLVNATAQSLLDDMNQDSWTSVLPIALANLIGTTHTFELRSNTYYQHTGYESFNCNKVCSAILPADEGALPIELDQDVTTPVEDGFTETTECEDSSPTPPKRKHSVNTPAKDFEHKKRRKFIVESSQSEDENNEISTEEVDKQ